MELRSVLNKGSLLVGVAATAAWWVGWLWPLVYVVAALFTFYYSVAWSLMRGKLYEPPPPKPQINIASIVLQKIMVRPLLPSMIS